jgi:flagellar hook protein FlgE
MLRSLYAGISGLSSNAVELDVIGNNIANANTVGYKSSRVTFREMLSQTIRPAQRPVSGGRGGMNAQQIGLGSSVGSIDARFTQGNTQNTGLVNDLALQGDGFFVLNDGYGSYYTRAGAFGLDSANYVVDPSTGMKLQGLMADATGEIVNGQFEDLFIDPSMTVPASASTNLRLFGNLDAVSEPQSSILESSHMMAAAEGTDLLTDLYAQNGDAFGLTAGDEITLTGMLNDGTSSQISVPNFEVGTTGVSLTELMAWIESSLETLPELSPGDVTLTRMADGSLELSNTSGTTSIQNLLLSVPSASDFNQSFRFTNDIGPGATGTTYDASREAGQIRAAASETDLLVDLYNSNGQSLGLNVSPTNPSTSITISGALGENNAPGHILIVDDTTAVSDLLTGLQIAFGVSSEPVSINSDGELVMQGETGLENALGQVDIREVGEINPILETSFNFAQTQAASDGQTFTVSSATYDSLGEVHNVQFTFSPVVGRNEWTWTAELEGNEEIVEGSSGTVSFSDTGEIISFRYSDEAGGLTFRPQPTGDLGAQDVTLEIDVGQFGDFNGLTQYAATGGLQSLSDGYTVGQLLDYEINTDGLIIGRFTNDTVQTLAKIGVARFPNNQGLVRSEGNTFKTSGNSGSVMHGFVGGDTGTYILSGALEGSNVDLTQELTNMVVAQRAFQANAKVISTGDQILQEIVQMIR